MNAPLALETQTPIGTTSPVAPGDTPLTRPAIRSLLPWLDLAREEAVTVEVATAQPDGRPHRFAIGAPRLGSDLMSCHEWGGHLFVSNLASTVPFIDALGPLHAPQQLHATVWVMPGQAPALRLQADDEHTLIALRGAFDCRVEPGPPLDRSDTSVCGWSPLPPELGATSRPAPPTDVDALHVVRVANSQIITVEAEASACVLDLRLRPHRPSDAVVGALRPRLACDPKARAVASNDGSTPSLTPQIVAALRSQSFQQDILEHTRAQSPTTRYRVDPSTRLTIDPRPYTGEVRVFSHPVHADPTAFDVDDRFGPMLRWLSTQREPFSGYEAASFAPRGPSALVHSLLDALVEAGRLIPLD